MKKKPTKADIARLSVMLKDLEEIEARFQMKFGDALPRSIRESQKKDAQAIRRVIEFLKGKE